MKKLIAILGLALSLFSVNAQMITRQGDDFVYLTKEKCTDKSILASALDKGMSQQLFKAKVKYEGKNYDACWVLFREQVVIVFYDDGEIGTIPFHLFELVK